MTDTIPCPPPSDEEQSEFAVVRSVDWKHGIVTLELKLPIELEELPGPDDEVELRWVRREAAE